jgi:hypothetical protein
MAAAGISDRHVSMMRRGLLGYFLAGAREALQGFVSRRARQA